MNYTDYLTIPGEHVLTLNGAMGPKEAVLSVPEQALSNYAALIGHPHSLQGGTMNNKVVTTLARIFKEHHIPSLRFNFRGVGHSAGFYDKGIGVSEDMIILAQEWLSFNSQIQLIFAGFSFGSFVTYRAASHFPNSILLSIAPPVHHYNYHELMPKLAAWLLVHGDKDEVVPYEIVAQFAADYPGGLPLLSFKDTTHFFHGKLIELKTRLSEYLEQQVLPQ